MTQVFLHVCVLPSSLCVCQMKLRSSFCDRAEKHTRCNVNGLSRKSDSWIPYESHDMVF